MATFREFIARELAKAGIKPANVEAMTSADAMKVWSAAFTHKTVNGISGENYEDLEVLGDSYLAAIFFSYIDSILPRGHPQKTPSYYTELRRYWLAKTQLAKFSDELSFAKWIKVDPQVLAQPDEHIKEDVFEAFFGAIVTTGDEFVAPGVGYMYATNYFSQFIEDHNLLLPEDQIFPRKTKLKELYDGMRWEEARYISVGDPNDAQITVIVLDNEGDELGRGRGRDRQAAEDAAAAAAINALEAQGITRASIEANRPVDQEIEDLKSRISRFLKRKGSYGALELVRVYKETGKNGRQLVELRTTQDPGSERMRVIQLSKGFASGRQARLEALYNYIREHKIPN